MELIRRSDAAAAARSLAEASRLGGDEVRIALARVEASIVSGRGSEAASIAAAIEGGDPLVGAARALVAGARDRQGDPQGALEAWQQAAASGSAAATAGIARTGVAAGSFEAEAEAWQAIGSALPQGAARTAAVRRAARIWHLGMGDPKAALALLADLPGAPAVEWARLDAAEAAGDVGAVLKAASAIAVLERGAAAAAAQWRAGRVLAREGRGDGARRTLEESLAADPSFVPARVELDGVLRSEGIEPIAASLSSRGGAGALRAAAIVLAGGGDARPHLDRAREAGATSASADVAAALASLLAQDPGAAAAALGRVAAGAPADAARALWLAAAGIEELGGGDPATLYEAALPEPAARLAVRRRTAHMASNAAAAAHAEADAAAGTAGRVSAICEEAAALERAGDEAAALEAWGVALALQPAATEAAAARARLLARGPDGPAGSALTALADAAPDAAAAASLRVRAALRLREADRAAAQESIRTALEASPTDVPLAEMAASMGAGAAAKARALMARLPDDDDAGPASGSSSGSSSKATAPLVEAAEACEAADLLEEAAALYRRALVRAPGRADLEEALVAVLVRAGELPAVTEHLLAEVREAPEGPARAAALERLADFDGSVRDDAASAAIAWSGVLEASPSQAAALRALERHLAGSGRREDILPVLEALISACADGEDAAAFARRAARIRRMDQGPRGVDDPDLARRALARTPSRWALEALAAEARAAGNDEALAMACGRLAAVTEGARRVAAAVSAGEALLRLGRSDDALAALRGAWEEDLAHPLAAPRVGALAEQAGDSALAAAAWESAGAAAADPQRAADDLHRAGVIAADRLGDPARALALLGRALERDPDHAGALERAAAILQDSGADSDAAAAESLLARRIALGGTAESLARFAEGRADLLLVLGRRADARTALQVAVGFAPEDVALYWRVAEVTAEDGAWEERAAALIEIARRVTDPAEVKTVFLDLGRLYDGELPDPQRAEASFRRVLQIDPNHLEALAHLSALGMAAKNWQLARDATTRLADLTDEPAGKAKQLCTLALILEEGTRDLRKAEATLEQARRTAPQDPATIDAGAAFHRRQGGGPPLAMWLDLSAAALRETVASAPDRADGYRALARVLQNRGRTDATRCTLAVVVALADATTEEVAGAGGYGAEASGVLADGATGDLVSPPGLPGALREVFVRMAEGFAALAPAEPKDHGASRADRLGSKDAAHAVAARVARELGVKDLEVYAVAAARPDAVLPGDPPCLVTAKAALAGPAGDAEGEAVFRVGRAVWLARAGLAAPLLFDPQTLSLLLLGLVRQFDPRFPVEGLDEAAVDEAGRRIGKHIPRRERDAILPFALEAAGARALDGASVRAAIESAADAAGLLACGRIDAALRAIGKDAGALDPHVVARHPRAAQLLSFAVSESYFEARRLAGIG